MTRSEIQVKIKDILGKIGSFDPASIDDGASFRDELGLDSLSLLEAGVDVDYAFGLQDPEIDQKLQGIDTVAQLTALVEELLAGRGEAVA